MVAVTRDGLLKKRLKQVGLFSGVFLGMFSNTAAFAEFSKEDERIEAFFWKSTTDPWLGERLNFKISYFGRLLDQVCQYPVNRSIGAVVIYQVGDVVKSEVRQLEVSCPFDGPPKSAFHFDYRYKLSENDSLFFELLQAKENGVPFEIELAFVDAYGNWDSREGENYHVQLLP